MISPPRRLELPVSQHPFGRKTAKAAVIRVSLEIWLCDVTGGLNSCLYSVLARLERLGMMPHEHTTDVTGIDDGVDGQSRQGIATTISDCDSLNAGPSSGTRS